MSFRNPLERLKRRIPITSHEDGNVLNRRQVLFGAAALAGTAMLPIGEANADGGPESVPVVEYEAKERNVEQIHQFINKLMKYRDVIESPFTSKQEKLDVLEGVPPTDFESLRDTEFDPEAFFRFQGPWPSVQIRKEYGKELQQIRRAHEENPVGVVENITYGNGFEIVNQDGTVFVFTNEHVVDTLLQCTVLGPDADIAACPLENFGREEEGYEDLQASLYWDETKRYEDLYGQLVHIPSIHEERGRSTLDNTDITSGILIKIQDSFFADGTETTPFFGKNITENMARNFMNDGIVREGASFDTELNQVRAVEYAQNRIKILKRSYMCIVPSRETNGDGNANLFDTQGISGSPVFTDQDCRAGRRVPSGIVWGTGTVYDARRKISYTVLFIHGPDVIGEMMDVMNEGFEEEIEPFRELEAVTMKIQEAINIWLRKNNRSNRLVDVDGVYGKDTAGAIYAFQMKVFGAPTTASPYTPGLVDARTWQALMPEEPFVDIIPLLEAK